jgi:antitoxin component YwqK of YwqJK toxin-antitoxin module
MKKSNDHPVDGPHKEYFAGGELSAEGRYKDGKKVGEWKVYDKSGALKQGKVFKAKRDGNYLETEMNVAHQTQSNERIKR